MSFLITSRGHQPITSLTSLTHEYSANFTKRSSPVGIDMEARRPLLAKPDDMSIISASSVSSSFEPLWCLGCRCFPDEDDDILSNFRSTIDQLQLLFYYKVLWLDYTVVCMLSFLHFFIIQFPSRTQLIYNSYPQLLQFPVLVVLFISTSPFCLLHSRNERQEQRKEIRKWSLFSHKHNKDNFYK